MWEAFSYGQKPYKVSGYIWPYIYLGLCAVLICNFDDSSGHPVAGNERR